MRRIRSLSGPRLVVAAVVLALGAGCAGDAPASEPVRATAASPTATPTTTTAPPTTAATAPPTTAPATTAPAATAATTTPDLARRVEIGRSVEGRPIIALERGDPAGTKVLVIGVIHGDEAASVGIVRDLTLRPLPPGVDLWLVESMNPDGQAAGRRTNANLVDLNRNFPSRWAPLGQPGDDEYAGTSAASEPETQAMVRFISALEPDVTIWYHQDLYRIAPGQGRSGELRERYAELTGLPIVDISGGTYTGTASPWQQRTFPDDVAFIVELGPTLSEQESATHAAAVLDLARQPG